MKDWSPKNFRYHEEDGVAVLRLDRPERLNSLTFECYRELASTFADLQERRSVRSVLLTGTGRAFCSGGDVGEIIGPLLKMDGEELLAFTRLASSLVRNICMLRKPVIAGLNGTTCGAGAVIALAADFRVASRSARIAFLFTKVGLCGADMGAAYLLPRVVGHGHATDLLMRGHFITADEAHRIGLYTQVVDDAELMDSATALARELADGPRFGLSMTKEMLYREMSMSLEQALEAEAQAQAICMRDQDYREAHQAFLEKRKPDFRRIRENASG